MEQFPVTTESPLEQLTIELHVMRFALASLISESPRELRLTIASKLDVAVEISAGETFGESVKMAVANLQELIASGESPFPLGRPPLQSVK